MVCWAGRKTETGAKAPAPLSYVLTSCSPSLPPVETALNDPNEIFLCKMTLVKMHTV